MKIMHIIMQAALIFLIPIDIVLPMLSQSVRVSGRHLAPMLSRLSLSNVSRTFPLLRLPEGTQNRWFSRSNNDQIKAHIRKLSLEYGHDEKEVYAFFDSNSKKSKQKLIQSLMLSRRIMRRFQCPAPIAHELLNKGQFYDKIIEALAQSLECSEKNIRTIIKNETKNFYEESDVKRYRDINYQDEKGRTLLYKAIQIKDSVLTDTLLEMEADPNIPDAQMVMPLHIAVSNGDMNYVRKLVDAGASMNSIFSGFPGQLFPCTPLRIAVEQNNIECVEYLLNNGASTIIPVPEYRVFLIELAKVYGSKAMVDLLEKHY